MAMPRKDYDKFLKYMQTHPNDIIFLSDYHTEKRYPNNWGKVRLKGTRFVERELQTLQELNHGVFVDLHPIDNIVPSLLNLQVKMAMFGNCVGKLMSGIYTGYGVMKKVYKAFSCIAEFVASFVFIYS